MILWAGRLVVGHPRLTPEIRRTSVLNVVETALTVIMTLGVGISRLVGPDERFDGVEPLVHGPLQFRHVYCYLSYLLTDNRYAVVR